jgi:transcriptional regulator with PAS, ATPase and Fis domain
MILQDQKNKPDRQIIGVSPEIRAVLDMAIKAGSYPDVNVLITGESGTGKENIARLIHNMSIRKDNFFCPVNCSAVTETLMESEFFGHKKGSFTGAIEDKTGYFELCHNGTLFLDEIADMPYALQAKLLRAIEEKTITRVGDIHPIYSDFRIISATNHNIEKWVKKKKFRLDLLFRLNTVHIHIPPLRERMEDLQPLLRHFVKNFSQKYNKPDLILKEVVFDSLMKYHFPGNVRELKNMVERAVIFDTDNNLDCRDFPLIIGKPIKKSNDKMIFDLTRNEKGIIRKALHEFNFNQQKAADALGIHRDALSRKMKKYNIVVEKEVL